MASGRNRITVEIDTNLEILSYQKGVKMPDRNVAEYNKVFDETARRIYEKITSRGCPEAVKVI